MKKLMILGASALQLPLIARAKERGLFVIVVSPGKDELGKKYADIGVEADVRNREAVLKAAIEYKIDGIITDQTDIPVRTVAYVAEKMGLPGIGFETACLFTDKYLMREKCKQLGIKTLEYKMCEDVKSAEEFFEKLDGKAIIKPVDNQGSRGVCFVNSIEELRKEFSSALEYSAEKKVLIEQVAEGREFVVEGMMYKSDFKNLIAGDTYYFDIPNVFSAYERVFPTNADSKLRERVEALNEKIIRGFNLKQGITHSEFIMNGDDIILIETAARGGGVFISSDLISLSTGLCTEDFLIDIALGNDFEDDNIQRDANACCYLAFYLPVGTIVSNDGIEEVRALPYTYRDNLDSIQVGVKTKVYTDKTSRYNVSLSANNREELDSRIHEVREILNGIVVKTEEGAMETPIWG